MNTSNTPPNACEQFKQSLVENGEGETLQSQDLAAHLENCIECQRLLKAWEEIPGLLNQLPQHEPGPTVVAAVTEAAAPGDLRGPNRRNRFLAPSLASAAVLLAAIGLSRELLMHESPKAPIELNQPRNSGQQQVIGGKSGGDRSRLDNELHRSNERLALKEKKESAGHARESEIDELQSAAMGQTEELRPSGDTSDLLKNQTLPSMDYAQNAPSSAPLPEPVQARKQDVWRDEPDDSFFAAETPKPAEPSDVKRRILVDTDVAQNKFYEDEAEQMVDKGSVIGDTLETESSKVVVSGSRTGEEVFTLDPDGSTRGAPANQRSMHAFDFLSHYQQTEAITIQPATGYWANTYVPGDPEIRLLNASLAQWDRSWLENNAALERSVKPVQQPFDAPADNALSLSLMADTQAIQVNGTQTEPTRLRLQVGIQGIEHRHGQRPAMNLGVVIDLPDDASNDVRIAARALLDGLLQSRQVGDRFSLVFTGPPGQSLVVETDDFRFGSLQLANQRIAGETPIASTDENTHPGGLDVLTALQLAGQQVRENEDPSRPLGSSSTWLIGAQNLEDLEDITRLAHTQARDGVTLSVFPLGTQLPGSQVEQLVLAGLGSRRYLEAPNRARSLVEEELLSASRAVARAVRLSVRLEPGVQLINVIGSERLDTVQAQRVRDIENSMDRRLSANLGIQADRGDDEEGIQIVIPSIFSGDSVTVLLDIITDRPGAIADVSLRYKDLVYLRNGNLSAQLELPAASRVSGPENRGPAELAVLKNLLSWHFAEAVKQAADALGQQNAGQAVAILRGMVATIEQARLDVPGFGNDPDLIRDQQVLERYIAALEKPQATSHQPFLVESLRFAAWAKTHHTPEEWK